MSELLTPLQSSTVTRRRIHLGSTMDQPKEDSPDTQKTRDMVMAQDTQEQAPQATQGPPTPNTMASSNRPQAASLASQGTVIKLSSTLRSLEARLILAILHKVYQARSLTWQEPISARETLRRTSMGLETSFQHPGTCIECPLLPCLPVAGPFMPLQDPRCPRMFIQQQDPTTCTHRAPHQPLPNNTCRLILKIRSSVAVRTKLVASSCVWDVALTLQDLQQARQHTAKSHSMNPPLPRPARPPRQPLPKHLPVEHHLAHIANGIGTALTGSTDIQSRDTDTEATAAADNR